MNTLLESPLQEVDSIFKQCDNDPEKAKIAVLKRFREKLDVSTHNLLKVPSINEARAGTLPPGSLVRFRCMIQDMYDPEYFIPCFKKDEQIITSLYRDVLEHEIPGFVAIDDKPMERSSWHCIAIPAENEWVRDEFAKLTTFPDNNPSKRRRSEEIQVDTKATRPFCFPLDSNQQSCIVKIYTDGNDFKLNETVEVVGILSYLPERNDSADAGIGFEEIEFKNPPTSIVPRIHAVFCKKIKHQNPLLCYDAEENVIARRQAFEQANESRCSLLYMLTKIMLGDSHCAEYVLMYLLSRIFSRRDFVPLGKFSLNVMNMNERQAKLLSGLCSKLVTKSHYLEMSLDKLNNSKFVPSKDYDLNRLQSGLLQLSSGTLLICDENPLDVGQLASTGVENVKALGNMIQNQSVQYNFGFHQMEFFTDIPVLYASQGRSLIKCDYRHKIIPAGPVSDLENLETHFDEYLTDSLLTKLRRYITFIMMSEHELNQNIQEIVQDDLVSLRKEDPTLKTDDLHALVVVARYVSRARGELELSDRSWEYAKTIERERRRRIARHD